MYFYGWTFIVVIPALILSFYAQFKVNSAYKKYSAVRNTKGYTAADVARQLLMTSHISDVNVEPIPGNLTDHYDPKSKTLRLSEGVYNSQSLAAIGIAAHETGHAIQDYDGYGPLALRSGLVPMANISQMAVPLVILGLVFSSGLGSFGTLLINIGILLYTVTVAFYLVTLPVEFNASGRAIQLLSEYNFLTPDEIGPAKKVLSAAALTYVAAALSAVLTLVRLVLLSQRRR